MTSVPFIGRFWRGLYCQFSSAIIQKESVQDAVLSLSNETKALHEHIEYLEKVGLLKQSAQFVVYLFTCLFVVRC